MALSKTIKLLETLSPPLTLVPIAGDSLVAMVGAAIQVCKLAESVNVNREEYAQLAREIAGYAAAVSQATQSDPLFSSVPPGSQDWPHRLQERWTNDISDLTNVFKEVMEVIRARQAIDDKRQGQFLEEARRIRYNMSHKGEDEEQIKQLQRKMELCIRVFHISTGIRELSELEKIKTQITDAVALQTKKMGEISEGIQQVRDHQKFAFIKQELKPVPGSRFSEEGMPNGCLANTRIKILEQLQSWATDEDESCPTVFGLTGPAGSGKTTVSISFCEHFDHLLPVINFLISRTTAERRSPTNIVHTLSYQLGVQEDNAQTVIYNALQSRRDIMARSLKEQVEELLAAPLRAWEGSKRPILLVIDALDECDKIDGVEGGKLIPLIASAIRQFSGRVKLFITSREEPEIRKMFKFLGVDALKNAIRLQDIEEEVVKEDIVLYYQYHFRLISERADFENAEPWPSQADFDLLVARTGKLFIFAALVVRLLGNPRVDPKKKLEEILRSPNSLTGSSGLQSLDELYLTVLKKAVTTGDETLDGTVQQRVHQLLSAFVLLQDPLSTRTLSSLLGESHSLVQGDVDHLSAVLIIPADDNAPTKIFHPSFADYVLGRCPDPRFRIDPAISHSQLLRHALTVMDRHLKRDICSIGDTSVMNADIQDLEDRRRQYLPPELRYACEYWLVHLTKAGSLDRDTVNELNGFCMRHLLYWIEVLSLLDKVSIAHVYLPSAIDRCRQRQDSIALTAMPLLENVKRIVEAYDLPIRCCALQVYCSVLLFMPKCKLDEYTKDERIGVVELKTRRLENWPSARQTLEGHTSSVTSVAYSSDATRIASGSFDYTVRVWDAITGETLLKLGGHTRIVRSVAFSSDGTRIVSGSDDKTVRVWDAITGRALAELKGHTSSVNSVAFSADGTRIVSGSDDKTVRVWDATTDGAPLEFNGHTGKVTSVACSSDGTRIVSGSDDKTVRVWDAITGNELAKLEGHASRVTSVAFVADGTGIVSGSGDKTVRVWDAITGRALAELKGHTSSVNSVAFSADGTRIVSGSNDSTVRVWDATTGGAPLKFNGHTRIVTSVAFSADGTRIISGSYDSTVRLWDTITGCALTKLDGHTDEVTSVAFSADGTRFVSGSRDCTMRIWDTNTGNALIKFGGSATVVTLVAFSPDGTRIASGHGRIVRVWDVTTGDVIAKLEGHTDQVTSVAFSPDGRRIASSSHDETVRLWDTNTNRALAKFEGDTDEVTSVPFSSGGTGIASGSEDNTVRMRDPITGRALAEPKKHNNRVTSVAFSLDGKRIASSSYDGTVRVWDMATGGVIAKLEGHTKRVTSVAFSPDGRRIVSGSMDRTVRVWDAITGSTLTRLYGHVSGVTFVAFSKDTQIISRDSSGSQHLWNVDQLSPLVDYNQHSASPKPFANSSSSILSFNCQSGWLEVRRSSDQVPKRLCWIPRERRGQFYSFSNTAIFFSPEGGITLLSISQM